MTPLRALRLLGTRVRPLVSLIDEQEFRDCKVPQYYFHIEDGLKLFDTLGSSLAGDREAERHAQDLAHRLSRTLSGHEFTIRVMNQAGREVCRIRGNADQGLKAG
jgi:hypothetical protein